MGYDFRNKILVDIISTTKVGFEPMRGKYWLNYHNNNKMISESKIINDKHKNCLDIDKVFCCCQHNKTEKGTKMINPLQGNTGLWIIVLIQNM